MSQKRSFAGLIILFFTINIYAQQKIKLESLVPPAPNAAELGKYGTFPVGTVTGIPEIGFPLYEINTGKLKLPISLSYHAAGIQVNQKSTDVGLGWSVMAGGSISRTVYGAADNSAYGYFNYTPPSYSTLMGINNYYTMQLYSNPSYDLEPDLFVYNIGGKSGKFICDKNKNFKTIPFDPIKIQKVAATGTNILFQIVDDNGDIYKFDQYSNTISDLSSYKNTISTWYLTSIISADLTDTITFVYETSYLEDPMEQQSYPIGEKMKVNGTVGVSYFSSGADPEGGVIKTQSINTYNELLLKQIKFKNGYVQFNRNTIRKDVNQVSSSNGKSLDEILVYNVDNIPLKKFTFYHSNFISTEFLDNWLHYRLKLTGFTESDPNMVSKKEYKFDYDATSLPPYGSYNLDYWGYYNGATNMDLIPATTVFASDISSYSSLFGSSYGNNLFSPTESWTIGSANREPSATYMKAGVLNKITYPTGGYSQFEFEPHQYLSEEYIKQQVSSGGQTIGNNKYTKSESSYSFAFPSATSLNSVNSPYVVADLYLNFSASNMSNTEMGETQFVTLRNVSTNAIIKTWKHEGDLTVPLYINEKLVLSNGVSYILNSEVYGSNTVTLSSTINWSQNTDQHPVKIGGGLRVKSIMHYAVDNILSKEENYSYGVAENGLGVKLFDEKNFYRNYEDVVTGYYVGGMAPMCTLNGAGNTWQRHFLGITKYNSLNYQGAPILYSKVTKYEGRALANIGKTEYNYKITPDQTNFPNEFINSGNYGAINNAWNQAELSEETTYKKDGIQFLPVTKTKYEYLIFNQTTESGILEKQYKQFVKLIDCTTDPSGPETTSTFPGQGFFSIYEYPIATGASRRTKETKFIYNQANPLDSIATITTTQYQNPANLYPTELAITTSEGISIKKITRLKYPQDMGDPVSLAMVSKNMLTPTLEEKLLKSVSGNETVLSTMQTIYKQIGNLIEKEYVKASTGGITPETRVQFNQYDANGNILEQQKADDVKQSYSWGYNNQYPIAQVNNASVKDIFHTSFEDAEGNTVSGDCITGKKSRIGGYAKSLANLTNGQYVLSYWLKSGNNWSLQITNVAVSGNAYAISLSGQVDEVRFYPLVAQMTTYCYEPLIGLISQCDVNNRINYYEYDAFNRLSIVRDQDKKIIKKICYNYLGQEENCTTFGNIAKTGIYTKQCSTGTGSQVTYTVPANTYSSSSQIAADALAQNDVNANGQNYANQNGNCTSATVTVSATSYESTPFYMTFTNNATGQNYYLNIYPYSNNSIQIPAGEYTVNFNQSGYAVSTYFSISYYGTYGTSATFYSVSINSATEAQIGY